MDLIKFVFPRFKKEKQIGVLQTPVVEFKILSKVYYDNNFIHTPTYTYNKVMRLFELVGVVNTSSDASLVFVVIFQTLVDDIHYF